MAVVRKLKNTLEDGRGNLIATGSGVPERSAAQVRNDMLDNVTRSMMPTGKAEVGVAPGGALQTEEVYRPAVVTPDGPTSAASPTRSYTPTARVSQYQRWLDNVEAVQKPAFNSRYESEIQSVLDNILNRKSFDLNTDKNYQKLYDQYAQQYMAQGNRAMRDTMGQAAALTGGYGSTAAQAAGSQAYDNYLQNLNDRNVQLMDLAYGIYRDDMADNYNQLGAVTGLDNTDYSRYRDDVEDLYRDRDYAANRLNAERAFDYGLYADDRSYDDKSYDDALAAAMKMANSGLAIPERYAQRLEPETQARLNTLAAQFAAKKAKGSGGGSRKSGSGAETKEETSGISFIVNDEDQESYELATIDRMIDEGYSDAEIAKELRRIEKEADKVRSAYIGSVKSR